MRQPVIQLAIAEPLAERIEEAAADPKIQAYRHINIRIYNEGEAHKFASKMLQHEIGRTGKTPDAVSMSTPFYWSFCADMSSDWPPMAIESWIKMPIYVEPGFHHSCRFIWTPKRVQWGDASDG